ncbi:hypothetical protein HY213_02075 [Candidatus Peregrinibacteria bacterium]|nr:hypothetical protein [Candidatus Peregrinibacteria bacterium]
MIEEARQKRSRAMEALRTLGNDPATGGEIQVKEGRFGPYITDGTTNVALGKKRDPQEISFDDAVDLLAKKRLRGPSKWRRRG